MQDRRIYKGDGPDFRGLDTRRAREGVSLDDLDAMRFREGDVPKLKLDLHDYVMGFKTDIDDAVNPATFMRRRRSLSSVQAKVFQTLQKVEETMIKLEEEFKQHYRDMVCHIVCYGRITHSQYKKLTPDRSRPARNIDFNKLIKLGIIERRGKGPAAYYVLKVNKK